MTKRTIHAGKTMATDGTLPQGDTLDIQGGGPGGGAGGTAIVDTAATNLGAIVVFGGLPGTQPGQAAGQGGLLDVAGVLTDQGSIEIDGGRNRHTDGAQGLGGTLSVSGTLSVVQGGSVQIDGGFGGDGSLYSPGLAGLVLNTGWIDNDGIFSLAGGNPNVGSENYTSGHAGAGAELVNTGHFTNTGSLLVQGGLGHSYYDLGGLGANFVDSGVLTNSGLVAIEGGQAGGNYAPGAAGGTLTISAGGLVANSGTIVVGSGHVSGRYAIGYGGGGGMLVDMGSLVNSGLLDLEGSATSSPEGLAGLGAIAIVTGTITSTGTILVHGSVLDESARYTFYGSTAASMVVDGVLTSSGSFTIGAGGSAAPYGYPYPGTGGMVQVYGRLDNSGSLQVDGSAADATHEIIGGPGGTLVASGGGLIDNTGNIIVQGGKGADFPGYFGQTNGGFGGVVIVDSQAIDAGIWIVQGGTGGTNGGADGAGGVLYVNGMFEDDARFEVAAGTGGGAAGTLALNGMLDLDATMDNDGVIVIGANSSIESGSLGTLHNAGLIQGSGTIDCDLVNDGTISVTSGQLLIDSNAVTSDGGAGIFTVGSSAMLSLSGSSFDASQSVLLSGPGSVLSVAPELAGVLVVSPQGGTLDVIFPTGGAAILNAADTDLSVFLAAAGNLTLSRMTAIAATGSSGNDTITALSSGQTLTGGLGTDMLAGAAATGDLFRDVAAGLNGDTIAGFAGTDLIDITDIGSGASLALSYTQHGSAGSLVVTNGSVSSTITLQGHFTTASFATASDMHGGVLISLHG